MSRSLTLLAPLAGWSTPLAEVPDEVFSQHLLGEGVAIDPTDGGLYAPCDGEVGVLPATRHAITLRADTGHEILMHVGIDTVALGGEGFTAHVAVGDRVRTGQKLLDFDLDLLARKARSLLTPVLVLEAPGIQLLQRTLDQSIAVGEPLLQASAPATQQESTKLGDTVSRELPVPLLHGIHARPAALLAAALKPFTAEVTVLAHGREASARSTVALMSLGIAHNDTLQVRATGPDASAALTAFEAALRQAASGEKDSPPRPQIVRPPPRDLPDRAPSPPGLIRGVIASSGIALGPLVQLADLQRSAIVEEGKGVSQERQALEEALTQVDAHHARIEGQGGTPAEIAAAHRSLLADPQLRHEADTQLAAGKSAAYAWRAAIQGGIALLESLSDERLRGRIDDLRDLEAQVQTALTGGTASPLAVPAGSIVLARELLPSQLLHLQSCGVCGIGLAGGGPTSHVALLAQAAGLPALVAMGAAITPLPAGTLAVLDAESGALEIAPTPARQQQVRERIERHRTQHLAEQAASQLPGRTADGHRIEVLANIGSEEEGRLAVVLGAEGCGLLRTEILFLERQTPPTLEEQAQRYQGLATVLAGRPLTIRTLDIGGDKPIPYLPLPPEENPALGLRGVRTSLWKPALLREQLAAILAVTPATACRVLLPMITDLAELSQVRAILEEVAQAGGRPCPSLGVMIETPAAALLADQLAQAADFFSIGTNDLTQYTLAMDRTHPELAPRMDALHPAVLRLIERVAQAAHAHGRPMAVCGGAASDQEAVPILLGLGVHELSVVPTFVPRLKALLRQLTLPACQRLAQASLLARSAAEVRAASRQLLGSFRQEDAA